MLGKLPGNAVEYGRDLELIAVGEACHVVAVELQYPALLKVDWLERALLHVDAHRLWHTSYQHVFPQQAHGAAMQVVGEGATSLEACANKGGQLFFAHAPAELLEVEGLQAQGLLFRGKNDALYVLLDGEEASRLDVVVAAVSHQVLDEPAGEGKGLDLVKDHERLPPVEGNAIVGGEEQEEGVEVVAIVLEVLLDFG